MRESTYYNKQITQHKISERETQITTQKISSTMGMGICHYEMADFEINPVEETKNPFQISERERKISRFTLLCHWLRLEREDGLFLDLGLAFWWLTSTNGYAEILLGRFAVWSLLGGLVVVFWWVMNMKERMGCWDFS